MLVDPFGRRIDYLRLSVTDRCDLRCVYCMPADQKFLPRADVLTLDEIDTLAAAFIRLGVRKLRLSGASRSCGAGSSTSSAALSRHLDSGALDELTLTTNGTRLAEHAAALAAAGIKRINVSLDSLDPGTFERLTRGGDVRPSHRRDRRRARRGHARQAQHRRAGARQCRGTAALIAWAHARGMDASLIETMPLGAIEQDRSDQYLPLTGVRAALERLWTLEPIADRSCGPARYVRVAETSGKLGFITPLTQQFLRLVQPRPADRDRHLVHVPGAGRPRRSAHPAARRRVERRTRRDHRRSDRAQAREA